MKESRLVEDEVGIVVGFSAGEIEVAVVVAAVDAGDEDFPHGVGWILFREYGPEAPAIRDF